MFKIKYKKQMQKFEGQKISRNKYIKKNQSLPENKPKIIL